MKQWFIFFIFSIAFIFNSNAQSDVRVFNYAPTSDVATINNSLYTDIEFIDDRPDVEYNVLKINSGTFESNLRKIVNNATINSMSKNGKLLLQLRNLRMTDIPNKDMTRVNFRANLYERKGDSYYLINSLESATVIPDKKNYQEILSSYISDYVINNLQAAIIDEEPYTIDDVRNVSLVEKQLIPLYSETSLKDGVYKTFKDFARQEPLPYDVTTKFKKDELKEVKIPTGKDGKLTKVQPKEVYAVVVGGQPYIATDKKYIPLYKDGDNFFFDDDETLSRTGVAPSFSFGMGSRGYRGGGIGIGIVTHKKKHTVTFVIDHLNGEHILLPDQE